MQANGDNLRCIIQIKMYGAAEPQKFWRDIVWALPHLNSLIAKATSMG